MSSKFLVALLGLSLATTGLASPMWTDQPAAVAPNSNVTVINSTYAVVNKPDNEDMSVTLVDDQHACLTKPVDKRANVEKRDDITHLFVCQDINFTGRCQNLETTFGKCQFLGNGFADTISSLGPDRGTTCILYDNQDCTGQQLGGIIAPGIFNLNDFGFNDRASAYRCN